MNLGAIEESIRLFFREEPLFQETLPSSLPSDLALIESGFLDSIAIFNLVLFLERKFDLRIEIQDLSERNFSNIDSIANLVKSKLGPGYEFQE